MKDYIKDENFRNCGDGFWKKVIRGNTVYLLVSDKTDKVSVAITDDDCGFNRAVRLFDTDEIEKLRMFLDILDD